VQRLDVFADELLLAAEARRWGLGAGDSPAFVGMHAAAAQVAGGSLHALRGVLDGGFQHAFHPTGGLHHALPASASGFCIYNDAAVAIAAALREREARVLYLDFDAPHGDGVQAAFSDEPRVLTFSIHETGRHLFPGTGFLHELGQGLGRSYSLNLAVEPFTEDGSWLDSLELLLPPVAEWFAPDVIVSQHGCDSHAWDPLTDLCLSTRAFAAQAHLVHRLAHRHAGGRWVALGGGGYDWARVVPRSWAAVWAEMNGHTLPERIPAEWAARWAEPARSAGFWPLPDQLLDDPLPAVPRRAEIERTNRSRAESLRQLAMPALVRHAYPAYRVEAAPLPDVVMATRGEELVSRVGSLIVDPTREDVVQRIVDMTGGRRVDSAIEALGADITFQNAIRVTKAGGTISNIGYHGQGEFVHIPRLEWGVGMAEKTIKAGLCPGGRLRLERLLRMIETGRVDPTRMTTHSFAFNDLEQAFDTMDKKLNGVIKPLITF
jgi:acetoin utilization deacetylase AcuC-like enzyme